MDAESPALVQPTPPPAAAKAGGLLRRAWRPLLLLALLLLLLWQWWRLDELQDELNRRASENQTQARQSQTGMQALTGRLDALDARLGEVLNRQAALEAISQELAKSRDERLLAEIEQAVVIAAQQLQLAGNVDAALLALQNADARLARAGQPQLLPLRRLLTRDIERLKAMPLADVPGIALKLEAIIAAIDGLPLAFEQRARPASESAAPPAKGTTWWQNLGRDLWGELRGLIRIDRVDSGEAALLSPNQVFFLRENLKLRLVNARLTLLQRDGRAFREDLRQARDWLEHYFDRRAKPVQTAVATLNALTAADLSIDAPSLNETLAALRSNKLRPGGAAQR